MRQAWIVWGWLFALLAAALPALWLCYGLARENPMGFYVDPATGEFTPRLYWRFFKWWVSGAVPVSLLALACLFVNRRPD
jgi:hypothetical protein